MALPEPHRQGRARASGELARYETLSLDEIAALPVALLAEQPTHLYLWVPNALLAEGLAVMAAWGFRYKAMLIWHKVRKDGGSDGRGVGFYFRNVSETCCSACGAESPHARPRTAADQSGRQPEARAQPQAGGALPDHRGLQPGAVPGAIRA